MSTEKIVASIGNGEYSFTVEVLTAEDERTLYRVVPDQPATSLDNVIPSWLEFDEAGVLQSDDPGLETADGKRITEAIWRAIQEQVLDSGEEKEA